MKKTCIVTIKQSYMLYQNQNNMKQEEEIIVVFPWTIFNVKSHDKRVC